ncbi:hypothetical protein [Haladaptatus sp. NG-SE-30]
MALESLQGKSKRYLARMTGFYLSVVAFVFFWLLAFNFQLVAVFTGWFDPALTDTIHFVHNVAGATWLWIWGLAMLAQLYRPARRITAMQVALILTLIDAGLGPVIHLIDAGPAAAVGAVDPASWMFFFGPVFVAGALHPARGELLTLWGFDRDSVDPVLLGLVALAVVPVVLYALGQANYQLVLTDEHAELGHYATMTYVSLSIIALAGLAALRNRGCRLAAYGAGTLAAMLAIASVFQPTMSGLDTTWAALAVLWALALIGAYEWSVRRETMRSTAAPPKQPNVSP